MRGHRPNGRKQTFSFTPHGDALLLPSDAAAGTNGSAPGSWTRGQTAASGAPHCRLRSHGSRPIRLRCRPEPVRRPDRSRPTSPRAWPRRSPRPRPPRTPVAKGPGFAAVTRHPQLQATDVGVRIGRLLAADRLDGVAESSGES